MSTHTVLRVIRHRCPGLWAPVGAHAHAGDVRPWPAADAPCAQCVGATAEFQRDYVM